MTRRTYLSIDLDYWSRAEEAKPFLSKVLRLDVPMIIVGEHHELLPHINSSGCRHLINVDYHDDMTGFENGRTVIHGVTYPQYGLPDLNEGTWGAHVRWARYGTFEWRHPSTLECRDKMLGICDPEMDVYTSENHPWIKITGEQGLDGISLDSVRAVGVSVSRGYYRGPDLPELVRWVCGGRLPKNVTDPWPPGEPVDLRVLRCVNLQPGLRASLQ